MTIDARDGMRECLARLDIRHLVVVLEALDQVAVPGLLVGHVDRRVTVDAGARLLEVLHALGEGLILEHVCVTALLAEIRGKRIARPHRLQPGILFEARLRHDGTRVGFSGGPWYGLASAVARPLLIHGLQVAVVLQRKVLAPDRGVLGLVSQLDDAEERILRLPLPFRDVDEECRDRRGGHSRHDGQGHKSPTTPPAHSAWFLVGHGSPRRIRNIGRGKFHMAHGSVTTDTRDVARAGVCRRPHRGDDGLVATAAVHLRDRPAGG